MRKLIIVVLVLVTVGVWFTSSSGSKGAPIRDNDGRPITPGTVVAQLARGDDGQCHVAPGQEIGVGGKGKAGEAGSVTLDTTATCQVVVARVDESVTTDPPTQSVSGGGRR